MKNIVSNHPTRNVVVMAALAIAGSATVAYAMPAFTDFGAAANLESMPGSAASLNTPAVDGCASQSGDGLTLAFNSNRAGTHDIYIARRSSTSVGFGPPAKLPAPVNGASTDEFCPTIARGGKLYFSSTRSGDIGDFYVTREGPKGWREPESLGSNINSSMMDEAAAFYDDDDGNEVMLFSRRTATGPGKIYQSVNGGPATLVAGGPHSSASDNRPSVTHDGKTIFFDSTRYGTLGGPDIWVATRSSTSQPFGTAVHLSAISSSGFDARPSVSWDGEMVTFSSNRSGSESTAPDIWYAMRGRDVGRR